MTIIVLVSILFISLFFYNVEYSYKEAYGSSYKTPKSSSSGDKSNSQPQPQPQPTIKEMPPITDPTHPGYAGFVCGMVFGSIALLFGTLVLWRWMLK
jgi:hypothetical protein